MNPKVFISHASEDKERFVMNFASKLRANGVDAWLDKWEMLPGDSLVDKIFEEGIKEADSFIIILSNHSVNKPWVREELNASFVKRIGKNSKIIPIVLDNCTVPECLQSTIWENINNHQNYEENFTRILNSILGVLDKPALGQAPSYATIKVNEIHGLHKIDTLIFTQACQSVLLKGERSVNLSEIYNDLKAQEISDEDIKFEIVNRSTNVTPKRIPYKSIDPISFEINIEKLREDTMFPFAIKMSNEKLFATTEIGKMSKSWLNVVSPDDVCAEYGADTLRLYEMFLGPLEQAKPWNTAGISGVFGFLKKLWRLYFDENGLIVNNDEPSKDNLKSLHKTIKKVAEDIEGFSFNTSVSQFMICVNELSSQNCHSRAILEPLAVVISPYAPHIAEELWSLLGHQGSIATVPFPVFDPQHLVESEKEYPVSFNGKMRFTIKLPLDLTKEQIEEIVMQDERTQKQLDGRTPNKVIIVPGKIINLVG